MSWNTVANPPTAAEIAANYQANNPGTRFAVDKDGTAVAAWIDSAGCFVPISMKAITGHWVSTATDKGYMVPRVNGKDLYQPEDWQEIAAGAH